MAHEVETMAWANEVPWHGLGNQVNPNSTIEEMQKAAGLDWRLRKVPLVFGKGDDVPDEMVGMTLNSKVAWVRDKDRKTLVVSSPSWRPMQPGAVLEFMRDYVEAGQAKLETAGSLRDGRVIWGLANLNHSFEVRPGDKVRGYLLITSPNDIGTSITIRTTTVRVVCANTMAMAHRSEAGINYKQNHMADFDVTAAKEAVGKAHEQLAMAERNCRILDKLKLSISDAVTKVLVPVFLPEIAEEGPEAVAATLLPESRPKILDEILASIEHGPGNFEVAGTGWAAMSGVTHWADHVAGRNQGSRLYRSWMGDTRLDKLAVEKKLLELAS